MDLTPLAVLAVGLVGGIALTEAIIRRTDVGAGLVLFMLVVQEMANTTFIVGLGPFSVHANDVVMVLLTIGGVARLLRTERPGVPQRLLIGLGLLLLWSIMRGIGVEGLTTAVNESRKFLGFVAAGLYFSTMEPRQELLDRIVRFWFLAAAALCAVTFVRWGASAVGLSGGVFGGGGAGLRAAVPSDPALVVGQAALLAVPLLRDRTVGLLRYATPVFLVFALLLQHRTVWVVVAAGLLVVIFRERTLGIRAIAILAAGLVVIGGLLFAVLDIGGDPVTEELTEELADSTTRTDTFEWRVGGWQALLRDSGPQTLAEVAVGRPFGSGWQRRFDGIVVSVSPHNFYLESLLRVGTVGLAGIFALYAASVRHRRRGGGPAAPAVPRAGGGIFSSNTWTSVIAVQLIYFITYSPDMSQGLLLGVAGAVAMTVGREPVDRMRDTSALRRQA